VVDVDIERLDFLHNFLYLGRYLKVDLDRGDREVRRDLVTVAIDSTVTADQIVVIELINVQIHWRNQGDIFFE